MKTVEQILQASGLPLPPDGVTRYYAPCPVCSHLRRANHQDLKCLGITITNVGVNWGCNHCRWTGGEFFNGKDADPIIATYEYTDEGGAPLSRKVRTASKKFWQQRWDGSEWVNSTKGVRRVLYRLPELIEAIAAEQTVLIVEGEKDVETLRQLGVPATCNFDGAAGPNQKPKWRPEYSEILHDADVVIIPDHDAAGYAHADAIAAMSVAVAKSVRILKLREHWPDCPAGGDVSDWASAGHTREELDALIAGAPLWQLSPRSEEHKTEGPKTFEPRFALVQFKAILLSTTPNYLIKGFIPREGLVVVWGPPKCGKSFWTFDLTMHIALGRDYRGHKVRQGSVVYLALEGGVGFYARVEAWRRQHLADHADDVPFSLLPVPVDLIADKDKLIHAIRVQGYAPAVVVIDTLNRSLNGNENDSRDMAAYIRAADAIREAFHCAVLIVHHCGIAGDRPRGHTSLSGADDAQIAVERKDDGLIIAQVEHMKDSEAGATALSRLESVDLGCDDDGDPITSCVVVPADGEQIPTKKKQVSGATKIALDLLIRALADDGKKAPASNHIPTGVVTCAIDLWRRYCYDGMLTESQDADTKRKAFHRASKRLQELRIIGVWQDHVWLAGHA